MSEGLRVHFALSKEEFALSSAGRMALENAYSSHQARAKAPA